MKWRVDKFMSCMKNYENYWEDDIENRRSFPISMNLNGLGNFDKWPHEGQALQSCDDHKEWHKLWVHKVCKAYHSVSEVIENYECTVFTTFFQRYSLNPDCPLIIQFLDQLKRFILNQYLIFYGHSLDDGLPCTIILISQIFTFKL